MNKPLLELHDVSAGYHPGHYAIQDVSMWVGEQTVVALLGGNGAGKSTVLRAVAGQVDVGQGSIGFRGSSIVGGRASTRVSMGMTLVPQGHQLYPGMTVRDNMRMGAYRVRRRISVDERIEHLCETFPVLGERSGQLAWSLSGGERAVLAVARGLMSDPKLLLLDEPSQGLAPKVRRELFGMFRRLCSESGISILLTEQDVGLALDTCDYAYVLQGGRVVAHGEADEIGPIAGRPEPRMVADSGP